ncbi:C40 family peptidase [Hufsiella ginkgonis]|uniref:Glycoside hydrolase n=1 Tax=Hufsiella ginkgonis TaxID=2695274 RepID=A0A7K1XT97_9SPHI|nr:NlpC/P60 family protein [Hufsiella ginkgonis]MXV14231.1 glycoside hydrolase [Hufsiella ginkgonis]
MGKKVLAAMLLLCFFVSAQAQTKKRHSRIKSSKVTRVVSAPVPETTPKEVEDPDNLAKDYFSQIMGVAVSKTSDVKLFQFIYEWIGTPYRLGGDTKRGVDCSGFAYQLYNKVFNTVIGNNSRNIFSMVNPVDKNELKEGDLVFFKIKSRSISHIGVYIGNNKFAHSSVSRGVMISNLDEPYWRRYYYKGGRLLESLREKLNED